MGGVPVSELCSDGFWKDIELQRLVPPASDIMRCALWNDDAVIIFNFVGYAIDGDGSLAAFDAEELIPVVVHFQADFLARSYGHQHQLQIVAGIEDAAEIFVLQRQLFDVVDKTLHNTAPWLGRYENWWAISRVPIRVHRGL